MLVKGDRIAAIEKLGKLELPENTRQIDSVVLKGRLLTHIDLENLLEGVATRAAASNVGGLSS